MKSFNWNIQLLWVLVFRRILLMHPYLRNKTTSYLGRNKKWNMWHQTTKYPTNAHFFLEMLFSITSFSSSLIHGSSLWNWLSSKAMLYTIFFLLLIGINVVVVFVSFFTAERFKTFATIIWDVFVTKRREEKKKKWISKYLCVCFALQSFQRMCFNCIFRKLTFADTCNVIWTYGIRLNESAKSVDFGC